MIDMPGKTVFRRENHTASALSVSCPIFVQGWDFPVLAYLSAGFKVFTLGEDALVVVDIILPAVLGPMRVVLVREGFRWFSIGCILPPPFLSISGEHEHTGSGWGSERRIQLHKHTKVRTVLLLSSSR